MKKKINLGALVVFLLFPIFFGCNNDSKNNGQELTKITVYCDEAIYDIIKPLVVQFDSLDPQGEVIFKKTSSMDAMVKLLSGETNAIILPRNYTHYEDSMMKVFSVEPHKRMKYAADALVFYVSVKSEIDTLTDAQIKEYLSNPNYNLNDKNRRIKVNPTLVINNGLSSEVQNLQTLVSGKNPIKRKLKMFNSYDSVKSYIYDNVNDIGIGYLSQIISESKFRPLSISFLDSNKKYIFPHVVHQSNIAQSLYPYIVNHYFYVSDKRQDLPMRLGRYLSTHPTAQKYINQIGLVPAFAKIHLIGEG